VFAFGTGSHYQGSLAPTHSGAPIDGIALG